MPTKEEVELVAELVGTTNAQLKKLDDDIVSSSANLKKSSEAWNPHEIIKQHIAAGGGVDVAPVQSGATPTAAVNPDRGSMPPLGVYPEVQAQPVQGFAQPLPQSQPQIMQVVTREFEDRLVQVEAKLNIILDYIKKSEKLDEKISNFVDRGLKNRVKQITLKLDDTKD